MSLALLLKEIKKFSDPKRAKASEWYFKTGKGEYGYGDVFIGLTVLEMRTLARKYRSIRLVEIKKLLRSKIHEERLIALFILVDQFKAEYHSRSKILSLYLANTKYVNNWDLVDSSAPQILGTSLIDKPKTVLYRLAKSDNLWERRIAIIATQQFIRNGKFSEALNISKILLGDKHDLIHKAVGWMLREVGNKNSTVEEKFLKQYYKKMPRTMLRYAIEKFPESKRAFYLSKKR